jgi:hypothetical protein
MFPVMIKRARHAEHAGKQQTSYQHTAIANLAAVLGPLASGALEVHLLAQPMPKPPVRAAEVSSHKRLRRLIALVIHYSAATAFKHRLPRLLQAVLFHQAADVRAPCCHTMPGCVDACPDCRST